MPTTLEHNHGRCDSTCPSDAHGCIRCPACAAQRTSAATPDQPEPEPKTKVNVVSFGYRHGPAPEADITLDVRRLFRNPAADATLIDKTGTDPAVMAHVLATPGVGDLITATVELVHAVLPAAIPTGKSVTVAIGCAGGRHRSVAIADTIGYRLAGQLTSSDIDVIGEGRDEDKPVVPKLNDAGLVPAILVPANPDDDIPAPSLRCPFCEAVDQVRQVDQAERYSPLEFADDGELIGHCPSVGEHEDFEHERFECAACRQPLDLPTGVEVYWP